MAEFIEVIKQRERMCEANLEKTHTCSKCPIGLKNNGTDEDCVHYLFKFPLQAQADIMKWARENPKPTNEDKLREVFVEVFGVQLTGKPYGCELIKCPHEDEDSDEGCDTCKYKGFWQKEYKEPKGEE